METTVNNRYDFIYLFDVQDGNPNGDPDSSNSPRIDIETNEGIITDVCLKRKVRNYIDTCMQNAEGYELFVKENAVLNNSINSAVKTAKKNGASVKEELCKKFVDIRMFGAVVNTGDNKNSGKDGQIKGAIQLTFSRSIDPICPHEICITRCASTNEKDAHQAMGNKSIVPYGLYKCVGTVSANFAEKTGMTEDDLELFWKALYNMFNDDMSSARGIMCPRKLIVFKHDSKLGNVPQQILFDLLHVVKNTNNAPRTFKDYSVTLDDCPYDDVTIIEKF